MKQTLAHTFFAMFFLFCFQGSQAQAFDYNFSKEEIEGVTLDMTIQEAKAVLEKRGYKEKEKLKNKGIIFESVNRKGVFVSIYSDVRQEYTLDNNTQLTEVAYTDNSPMLFSQSPDNVCEQVKQIHKKFCPMAGDEACPDSASLNVKTEKYNDPTEGGFLLIASGHRRCVVSLQRKMSYEYIQWEYPAHRDLLKKTRGE